MPRQSEATFTLGKITVRQHPTAKGKHQARGYIRDGNFQRREVTASGTSKSAAEAALKAKVAALSAEFVGGDGVLNNKTLVPKAAAIWLDEKEREEVSESTLREYRGYVDRVIKGSVLANLTVTQANDIARIEAWLAAVADQRGATAAKQSRKVLSGILGLCERRGAIPSSVMHRVKTPKAKPGSVGDRKCKDPDCDYVDCDKRHLDTERAFTPQEATKVLAVCDQSTADVGDLAAFLFGTGVRISEALHHTAWEDVDFDNATVFVRGTKTDRSKRVLPLSDDLVTRLKDRAERFGTKGLVFGVTRFESKLGEPRTADNVLSVFRRCFKTAGVPWAGSHTFRRSVATWMDASGAPLAEIANQLGHGDVNVTAGYLGRKVAPTRAAQVMVLPKVKEDPKNRHLSVVGGE